MTQPYGGSPPPEGSGPGYQQPAETPGGPGYPQSGGAQGGPSYGQPPQPPQPGARPGEQSAPAPTPRTAGRDQDDELRGVKHTRTGQWWAALALGLIILILLIVFIAQNSNNVPIHFLGFDGHFPLALALLIAAAAGAFIALILGTMRIIQLRRALKRSAGRNKAGSAPR